jgi:hypothetical protein
MAARILAQALVMGGTILGRAFITAYQKALVNAAKNGGGAATDRAKDKTVRMLKGMTIVEAESILGVECARPVLPVPTFSPAPSDIRCRPHPHHCAGCVPLQSQGWPGVDH